MQYAGLRAMAVAAKILRQIDDLGFSYAARLVSTVLPAGRGVRVRYDDSRNFGFPYGDGYWSLLLNRSHVYEEEVEAFLLAIRDIDYAFVDCGANYGYWSVQVSSPAFGTHSSVAVEADHNNFDVLTRNWENNGQRFKILHRAISGTDGDKVALYGRKHEARSIVDDGTAASSATVTTMRLDTLLKDGLVPGDKPIVLKLDIEGVEIAALEGAPALLDSDMVLVYEDHGNDLDHEVTRYLMDTAGMRVYAFDRGVYFRIESADELGSIKTNKRRGYDFFATRSAFWQAELDLLTGRAPETGSDGAS